MGFDQTTRINSVANAGEGGTLRAKALDAYSPCGAGPVNGASAPLGRPALKKAKIASPPIPTTKRIEHRSRAAGSGGRSSVRGVRLLRGPSAGWTPKVDEAIRSAAWHC